MVHNHWLVGFGSQEVTSVSYGWSLQHGGCWQDRSSHPGGDCAYGSGAWAWSGPHGTVSGIRWDDARYDCKDCPERRQSRRVPALDCEPGRPRRSSWTTSDDPSPSWTTSASDSVEGWNLMLGTRPAGTALNLPLAVILLRALHSANWRRIVWKPILPAALQMRGGMSGR